MTIADRERWDAKYADRTLPAAISPPEWLVQQAASLEPGRALDLACGEGHAAIWLAERGWQVTGVDISPVGLTRARMLAEKRNLTVDWQLADLDELSLGREEFDLITVFRFLDRRLAPRICQALRKDGLLIYETFLSSPEAGRTDPAWNPAYRLQPGELSRLFDGLSVLVQEEGLFGQERTARVVARKALNRGDINDFNARA
ncbi:MAG: class I SAM-dependent methyltransferase [Planctomycetaceae bacterium]